MMTEKIIIDVRTREEYVKDHIKGALNIPLHDLEFNHDFLKDKQVSIYCNSGVRAKIAKKWLKMSILMQMSSGGIGRRIIHGKNSGLLVQ